MATKMAVATMLEDRVGEQFDAVVTGLKGKQKWCRIGNPPVEGSLFTNDNVEVGDKLRVKLSKVNVEKGHIDFQKSGGR
jgi:exoribonuclease-2